MSEQNYRPDVDGLRAIAVSLVLLFHGGLAFSGGFVGVDVFFVISGYLITRLILKEQQVDTFRLATFWSRRIRRIVPAASVMSFTTLIAASVLLFPDDYEELARSTLAQQAMASNFFFTSNTGYFEGPADLKPLLHTWSLAVEEQFYLVYPLCLVVLRGLRRRMIVTLLGGVAVASLAISEWNVRYDPGAAFYLLPSRAWELLVGGLLCFLPVPSSESTVSRRFFELLSLAGITLIFIAALNFDASTRFPGIAALLPSLGAAAIIYSNSDRLTLLGRILAWKPIVFVGLLSYSLYLWHWPLFAFSRYWLGQQLSVPSVLLVLGSSLTFAYLSWRFVETPLRRNLSFHWQRPVFIGICATVPLLILLSVIVIAGDGFPFRIAENVARYSAVTNSKAFLNEMTIEQVRQGKLPVFGDDRGSQKCLVWGDSHAMALVPGVAAACQQRGIHGFQATHSSTAPLIDFVYLSRSGLNESGPIFSRVVLDFVFQQKIEVVILAGYWSGYAENPSFEKQLDATINELTTAGVHVAIVLDVAIFDEEVPNALAKLAFLGKSPADFGIPVEVHLARNRRCDAIIRRVAAGRAVVIDPAPYFVNEKGLWRAEVDGVVMYRDIGHLSAVGATQLAPLFDQIFNKFEQNEMR